MDMQLSQLPSVSRDHQTVRSNKPSAVSMRKRRAAFRAQGLNAEGKPFVNQQHPELHGLRNHAWYCKLWNLKKERQHQ